MLPLCWSTDTGCYLSYLGNELRKYFRQLGNEHGKWGNVHLVDYFCVITLLLGNKSDTVGKPACCSFSVSLEVAAVFPVLMLVLLFTAACCALRIQVFRSMHLWVIIRNAPDLLSASSAQHSMICLFDKSVCRTVLFEQKTFYSSCNFQVETRRFSKKLFKIQFWVNHIKISSFQWHRVKVSADL